MSVTEGRKGKVQVRLCTTGAIGSSCRHTVAEMGNWSITGWQRDLMEVSAFQDTAKRYVIGLMDAGGVTFGGYYDPSSTEQTKLIAAFTSGKYVGDSTAVGVPGQLRFFANSDTTLTNYGFWSCTGSNGKFYITNCESAQDKSGVGTFNMTVKVSCGLLGWSTIIDT